MMKIFVSALAMVVVGFLPAGWAQEEEAVAQAAGEAEAQPAPNIACDEPVFNFGDRDQNDSVEHTYVLKNTGDLTLTIENVKTSCGCTVANISLREVPPGESTEVTAVLKLKNRRGRQRKGITVESNDPDTPKMVLYLEGNSTSLVQVNPQRVYFGQIDADAAVTSVVSIVATTEEALAITKVESHVEHFKAEVETVEEGRSFNIVVSTVPPLPNQPIRGNVRVTTDNPKYPVVDINCSATILDALMVAPNQIIMAERPEGVTRYVVVRPGKTKTFAVEKVEPPFEDIAVSVTSMGANGYQIRLDNVVASKELDGKILKITTDVESKKEIEIPFKVVLKS